MTEPKWTEPGMLPTEPGKYIDGDDDSVWEYPEQNMGKYKRPDTRYYGPIPDPPKPLPKLRRFEATYTGERVAGVFLDNLVNGCRVVDCSRAWLVCRISDLTDIKWLDEEE